jgi:4-amino-4-deoxy-L-arabinose transferase-like glycosyltransferase
MASAESTTVRLLRRARSSSAVRRAGGLVTAIPAAVAILFAAGVILRLCVVVLYEPALVNNADTPTYVAMANGGLFGDPVRPSGYPMFLIALHAISDELTFTIAVQHLLGIATALLLYATARRIGAPVWVAAVGAAAVLLSLDQIVLEHLVLSDALFTFVLAVVLYACVRALDDPRPLVGRLATRHVWILAAGLALGLGAWVRGVGAALVPFLILWLALAIPGRGWERIGRGALAASAAAALLLVYFALNESRTGTFGLTQSSGWSLYSRVAPFADCRQFTPPAGTESLCEDSPIGSRYGPDFYGWEVKSPAHKLFFYPPRGDDQLGAFARQAIIHQPRAYVWAVGNDTLRYFLPDYNTYAYGGPGYDTLDIQRHDWPLELEISGYLGIYYDTVNMDVNEDGVRILSEVQDWVRVHPWLMLVAMFTGLAGIVLARGRVRAVLVLLCGAGVLLLLIPSATANYNARYAIPSGGPILLGGAIGLWVISGWLSARRRAGRPREGRASSA